MDEREGMSDTVAPGLPDDVVGEILARLPVRTVLRFKSVCKDWLALLSDPSFVRRHLDCSRKKLSTVILPQMGQSLSDRFVRRYLDCSRMGQSPRNPMSTMFFRYQPGEQVAELLSELPIPAQDGTRYDLSHCDGLLAAWTRSEIHVCNPATRELMTLPHSTRRSRLNEEACRSLSVSLCHDTRSGAYKVFRTYYRPRPRYKDPCNVEVEVLTLGPKNPRWRRLRGMPCRIRDFSMVCVSGVLYWLATDYAPAPGSMVCFDLSAEKFAIIPGPPGWLTWGYTLNVHLCEIQGKLCFFHVSFRREEIALEDDTRLRSEIWFMSGTMSSPSWTQYCCFEMDRNMNRSAPLLIWRGLDEILLHCSHCLYSYDRRSDELKELINMADDLVFVDPTASGHDRIFPHLGIFRVSTFAESLVAITPQQARGGNVPSNGGSRLQCVRTRRDRKRPLHLR